jgi:hypothetical protein
MKKPHEQEWKVATYDSGVIVDARETRMVAETLPGLAPLIAAAPDMARALMGVLTGEDPTVQHTGECWEMGADHCLSSCVAVKNALRKAGVIP